MHKKLFKTLFGLVILLSLILSAKTGDSFVLITNDAGLSYTNAAQVFYYSSYDSAQIYVYYGPVMVIRKTTKNLRTGDEGSNTQVINVVPGDTAEMYLNAQNTGDTLSHIIEVTDTFPAYVGAGNSLSYVAGSETCAINGSFSADSVSWRSNTFAWTDWQTYTPAVSTAIPVNCTGLRWRWNYIVNNTESETQSWIRMRYQWKRNQN